MKRAILTVALICLSWRAVPAQERVQYFPPHTFSNSVPIETGVVSWYSKHLSALSEPSLWKASKEVRHELYRFLWLRTWDPPLSIRVERNEDGTATLTLKVATGSGGYEPGKLNVAQTKKLTKEQSDTIADRFTASGFWDMASTETSSGRDGAQWVLEAAKNGRYHVVDRWSPKVGPIRDLALHILELSDYKISSEKVY